MELNESVKKQILKINLASVKNEEYEEGIIQVDLSTFDFFIKTLEEKEMYEDCKILIKNKERLLIS